MVYEWRGTSALRRSDGDNVEPGEMFEPTDAERRAFGGLMVEAGADYESMDYDELRELAADADTDAIDGRSPKAEIIDYFADE